MLFNAIFSISTVKSPLYTLFFHILKDHSVLSRNYIINTVDVLKTGHTLEITSFKLATRTVITT